MAQTYTTQWFNVSNGEITTHNPQSLAPTGKDIRILSADVQWEGITTSEEQTETTYDTNTAVKNYLEDPLNSGFSSMKTFPDKPAGEFNYARVYIEIDGGQSVSGGMSVGLSTGETDSTTFEEGFSKYLSVTNYDEIPDTGSVSISPDGSFNGDGSVNYGVEVQATESNTTTTTVYRDTQDPRVTRDVSGESGGITLTDGEQSAWVSLDGLAPNPEEFYHDIDGSGEARFRFRFDWEAAYPDALKQARVYDADADAKRLVALADPSDPQLAYTAVRVAVGGTVYALDVVDPSDPDAITSHRIQHPTHGTLCPRAFDTV